MRKYPDRHFGTIGAGFGHDARFDLIGRVHKTVFRSKLIDQSKLLEDLLVIPEIPVDKNTERR